jgi:hypothetical protein
LETVSGPDPQGTGFGRGRSGWKNAFEFEKQVFGYQEEMKPLKSAISCWASKRTKCALLEEDDASEERTLSVEEERLNQSVPTVKGGNPGLRQP